MSSATAQRIEAHILGKSARPLLKWAGGKTQLLPEIRRRLPSGIHDGEIMRYVEPFVGGAAVYFLIRATCPNVECVLIDINAELINLYLVVQSNPEKLIEELNTIERRYHRLGPENRAAMFYDIRDQFNRRKRSFKRRKTADIRLACDLVFLNRTCFNGLYRLNSSGEFNVPHGRYARPRIADVENIFAASDALEGTILSVGDYKLSKQFIRPNTFVYFDPPYRPLSDTAAFVSYERNGFNDDNQIALANYFAGLSKKEKTYLMLSNSDPTASDPSDRFFDELYSDFSVARVSALRNINSKGSGRGAVSELIITNYR